MGKKITPEQRAYVLAHLNDRPRKQAARDAGISLRMFYNLVKKHGGQMLYGRRLQNPQWAEIVSCSARKWKTRRKLDEMRVWNGEKQRTRFHFSQMSRKAYTAKWHLKHFYNYFDDPEEPYTLRYNDTTRRRDNNLRKNGNEAYYAAKYHFTFKPADKPQQ